jgi:hypothetical protein
MGMFQNQIQINYETITSIMQQLVADVPEDQKAPLIVRLRGTWLLEKVARNSHIFREDKEQKMAKIFEPLCDYFSKTD